jgi:hypothetical protein
VWLIGPRTPSTKLFFAFFSAGLDNLICAAEVEPLHIGSEYSVESTVTTDSIIKLSR